MEESAAVQDIVQVDILMSDVDFVDGSTIGELARRSVGKYRNSVRLLTYTSLICFVSNINAFFNFYLFPSCESINDSFGNQERHLKIAKRDLNLFPKEFISIAKNLVWEIRVLWWILEQGSQFRKLFIFNSWATDTIAVASDTIAKTMIRRHIPISVTTSPFLRRSNHSTQFQFKAFGWVLCWWLMLLMG